MKILDLPLLLSGQMLAARVVVAADIAQWLTIVRDGRPHRYALPDSSAVRWALGLVGADARAFSIECRGEIHPEFAPCVPRVLEHEALLLLEECFPESSAALIVYDAGHREALVLVSRLQDIKGSAA